jgi:hypothetical protein
MELTRTLDRIGDWYWNEHRTDLTHIVPSIAAFDVHEDTATLCGQVTDSADLEAHYPMCPQCVTAAEDEA